MTCCGLRTGVVLMLRHDDLLRTDELRLDLRLLVVQQH